ncbi:MAG: hypothetical protein HY744_26965 [Deltaproteobacteria bacterium]|nr:hypothetical protein [Deltaproteobacteria bacterium]
MGRSGPKLTKKSFVVDAGALREWVRAGAYRNDSEAVRAAIARALAVHGMQEAVRGLQSRGTFARQLG